MEIEGLIPSLKLKGLALHGPPCTLSRRFIRRESSESRVLSAIIESARGNNGLDHFGQFSVISPTIERQIGDQRSARSPAKESLRARMKEALI